MDHEDIRRKQDFIEKNLDWIEEKTDKIFHSFEAIKDCVSEKCLKKKKSLFNEFNLFLNKIKIEEENITKLEKEMNFSGINE